MTKKKMVSIQRVMSVVPGSRTPGPNRDMATTVAGGGIDDAAGMGFMNENENK